MIKQKILVVEDEKIIQNYLVSLLTSNNYHVISTSSGMEAVSLATSNNLDVILLDLGLPDIDGMDVLKSIRKWSHIPIIVVSARLEEQEKVDALDAGANDYMTKPFGHSELMARIRTAIRQHNVIMNDMSLANYTFRVGGLLIDNDKIEVTLDGSPVHLTPIEYKIVLLLARNVGKVLTHDYIIREIWGPLASDSQTLRVNMANIRRKIETNPAEPIYIITEIGVGYWLSADV